MSRIVCFDIFRLLSSLLVIFLVISVSSDLFAAGDATRLVRIQVTSKAEAELLPRNLDIPGYKLGEWVDAVVTDEQITDLTSRGLFVQLLHKDVNVLLRESAEYYPTWLEYQAELHAIVNNHPSICTMDTIGYSYELRPIQVVKLSDNVEVDEDEPEVLFDGLTHAREWPGLVVTMFILDSLTSAYGTNPGVTAVVDAREIFFIPCINPDGYVYTHDEGHDWRKTRRPYPEWGTIGTDINRNYGGSTNGNPKGEWGTTIGSVTHNPGDATYCGPIAFSEIETRNKRDFIIERDFCAGISYHTYSELVIWPWGYYYDTPPNSAYLTDLGEGIAALITQEDYTGTYDPGQSVGLYPTTGDATDWGYGYCHYVKGADFPCFTVEIGQNYQPPTSHLPQICRENFDGAWYLLMEAGDIRADLTPRVIPPIVDELGSSTSGDYTVQWTEVNSAANPTAWQIDEMTDLDLTTEDVEGSTDRWDLGGFSTSTSRAHSGTHSFKSTYDDEVADGLTTLHPYYVQDGDSLTFWTWYDIEIDGDGFGWDFGYVEVSTDGRLFDILEMYTGNSGGWVRQAFSLEDYVGESVFFRFRYTTDSYSLEEGYYIDDVYPTPFFSTITTLSSTETNTYYDITGQAPGSYYYRVRGNNTEWGWCDYSTIEPMTVINENAGNLTGVVTDSVSGDPLSGVLVELLDGSTIVSSDVTVGGNYVIAGIDAGFYDLRATADGFQVKTITGIEVQAQQVETVNIVLAPSWGNIEGVVTCAFTSDVVVGATIEIKQFETTVHVTETDSAGHYFAEMLMAGTYDLVASHPDYWSTMFTGLTVEAGLTLEYDFTLNPLAICGDVNGSTEVDIDDIVYIVGYIFMGGPAPDPVWTGDVNCSGGTDIDDAVYLISFIFAGGPAPCEGC